MVSATHADLLACRSQRDALEADPRAGGLSFEEFLSTLQGLSCPEDEDLDYRPSPVPIPQPFEEPATLHVGGRCVLVYPSRPCTALPGSPLKQAVLRLRALRGLSLWHPQDADADADTACARLAAAFQAHARARLPVARAPRS